MALATQCPHCLTIFRVASDQLKLRNGLVRCGSCREVFNGNEFLVEPSIADGHYQPAPGSKAQAGTLDMAIAPQRSNAGARRDPLPDVHSPLIAVPATPPAPEAPLPGPAIAADTAPAAVPPAATIPLIAEPKVFRSPASPGYIPDLGAPLKPAQSVDNDKSHQTETVDDDDRDSGALLRRSSDEPEDLAAPPEVAAVFRIESAASPGSTDVPPELEPTLEEGDDRPSHDEQEAAEEPGFVKRAERKARVGHATKMLMMVLAGVMVPVLLLQSLYYWRNPLAASVPVLRPMLNGMCVAFHCTVGLPTEIDRLSLESNELQVVPPNQNVYGLTVVMRNRGTSAQAWPHIELTLNNDDEKAVVRKVFRPRDYLSDASLIDNGLAADTERQIKLNFELKDALVSGYRIYLFYP
ncbi:DUF3426 domain-containing protein [Herbaspirillum sp. AP02]|uniref:DUF3426 domain-containing protein n=1 Tax=unclassified Herbaspirillum TaxID=2624150 RepID=UPI0015DA9952|nr:MULTISPECIES: DUF3426 domain-containing protein [unclassified Herbaspirillum]MBG7620277.1 DUF3426 domain-containing protein [Herbaspirillum sp. AP02]NZD67741.1 DUF3426 domain-containing protein [Herbaspirillum sp. AP21]